MVLENSIMKNNELLLALHFFKGGIIHVVLNNIEEKEKPQRFWHQTMGLEESIVEELTTKIIEKNEEFTKFDVHAEYLKSEFGHGSNSIDLVVTVFNNPFKLIVSEGE